MPYVEVSLLVSAAREIIYPILKDMEKYPEFMKDLVSVRVLSRDNNTTITHWISNVDGRIIEWKEQDVFDDENMHIAYCQLEGDLKKMQGEWILQPFPEGTEIKLTVDFDLGIPMLSGLMNPILKSKVRSNGNNMLEAIRERLGKPEKPL